MILTLICYLISTKKFTKRRIFWQKPFDDDIGRSSLQILYTQRSSRITNRNEILFWTIQSKVKDDSVLRAYVFLLFLMEIERGKKKGMRWFKKLNHTFIAKKKTLVSYQKNKPLVYHNWPIIYSPQSISIMIIFSHMFRFISKKPNPTWLSNFLKPNKSTLVKLIIT